MKRVVLGLAAIAALACAPARAITPPVVTPQWVRDAVFYQIFPERFANGNPKNDPPNVQPWGSRPTPDNFMGGDLAGVHQHLGYLKALGVNAIYFNPIFEATTNHKYNATDYMTIDPHFGTLADFKSLLADAHRMGIRVILDGVFNHTGVANPLFQDCVRNGPQSRYWNWYHFDGYPVVMSPKPNYEAWWGIADLPKLQVAKNPQVANYIYRVETYWLKQGIDGWRLDVPNEIDSDAFWRGFRARAKAINPNAYLVGEIWTPADRWLQGDQFDAVMDYPWRDGMVQFFAQRQIDAAAFDAKMAALRAHYAPAITAVMFNLLDSHDTARFLTDCGGEVNRLKLAVAYQMTTPGAPVVYYGDEIGMQGAKDPDCRRCFDWNPAHQNHDLWGYYQKLIGLRHGHPALRDGTIQTVAARGDLLAYAREKGSDRALVVLNNGGGFQDTALTVPYADGTRLHEALSDAVATVRGGKLAVRLDPMQAQIWLP